MQGVRSNQLTGYGLVVGLDGTGDQTTQTPFTTQSLIAMLQQLGVTVPPGTSMQLKNVAAVMVTAQLPPFAQPGQTIDVNVSSLGNAKSLRGGTLIATPLKGADGQIYALAQGNLIVGGAGAAAGGSKVQINHLSAGRVPDGATVERAVPTPLQPGRLAAARPERERLPDRARSGARHQRRMGEGIGAGARRARGARAHAGRRRTQRVAFLADIENLPVELATPAAKVVLNARTGSVVMNEAVTLGACAVAHGNLSVTISSTPVVSQPGAASPAASTVVTREGRHHDQRRQPGALIQMPAGAKLADVVKALNALGATPQDLLAILQAMKSGRRAERRARGDLMAACAARARGAAPADDAQSLDALRAQRRARPEGGDQGSGQAVRGAVHAGADEEHARGDAELGHARQRRQQARHRDARHSSSPRR